MPFAFMNARILCDLVKSLAAGAGNGEMLPGNAAGDNRSRESHSDSINHHPAAVAAYEHQYSPREKQGFDPASDGEPHYFSLLLRFFSALRGFSRSLAAGFPAGE